VASQTGLVLALNTLEVQSNYQKAPAEEQRAKLRHLEERFARSWGATGRIAEAFGAAWAAARGPAQAIQWYEKALAGNDGTASLRTIEQLGNLRARQAWTKAGGAQQGSGEHAPQSGAPASRRRRGRTKQNPRAAGPAGMPRAALDGARVDLMDALAMLERIAGIQPTVERNSLCGSVWKRKALLETIAKNSTGETEALAKMREYYEKAEKLAREAGQPDLFYPALNRMAAELIVNGAKGGWKGFERASTAEVRKTLSDKMRDDPDFWSAVGLIELRLYEALARRNLAAARASIEAEYEELRERVSAAWMWASVYDQLRFVLPRYAERASQTEKAGVAAVSKRIVGCPSCAAGDCAALQPRIISSPLPAAGPQPRFARIVWSLSTSTTAGLPAPSAFSKVDEISAGFSTRKPAQPIESATFAKFTERSKRAFSITPPE